MIRFLLLALLWAVPALAQQVTVGAAPGCVNGAACSPLSITINSATFMAPTGFSTGELLLRNAVSNQNVLALQSTSTTGFSALTVRGDDGIEHLAIGHAGSASGYLGGNLDYLEISNYNGSVIASAPPDFAIALTGLVGGVTTVHEAFRLVGATDKWTWKEPNSGAQTMLLDPINGTSDFNGTVQIGNGGTSPTQVGTLDVYGAATVGSGTSSRSTDATATFNIDAASPTFNIINNGVRIAQFNWLTTPARMALSDATGSKNITEWYMDNSGTFAVDNLFVANGQIDATAKVLMSPTKTDTVNDSNDTLVIQRPNFAQIRIFGPDNAVNGFFQVNKSGNSNSLGGTAAGLQISTQSAHPLSFGTNGHLALSFDASTVPVATLQGNLTAAGLATVGTIAGSLCATSGGVILYESGATGCTISLEELKHDIFSLSDDRALADVMGLKPIRFVLNDGDQRMRYGFGAHQVEGVDKNLSTYDGNGALQAYDPNAILAATVLVVQSQQHTIHWLMIAMVGGGAWLAALTFAMKRRSPIT